MFDLSHVDIAKDMESMIKGDKENFNKDAPCGNH